jgi:hypothetical protein
LTIPFSSLSIIKTAFEITASVVCPAVSEPVMAEIIASESLSVKIWQGVQLRNGQVQLELMLSGPLSTIRYDRGGGSASLTLEMRYPPPIAKVQTRSLRFATQQKKKAWQAAMIDSFLNPGDTVTIGASSFIAGKVTYLISADREIMTVESAS